MKRKGYATESVNHAINKGRMEYKTVKTGSLFRETDSYNYRSIDKHQREKNRMYRHHFCVLFLIFVNDLCYLLKCRCFTNIHNMVWRERHNLLELSKFDNCKTPCIPFIIQNTRKKSLP